MAISKKLRQQVYEKYGGRCAYTGKPLDDKWQVDHVTPYLYLTVRYPSHLEIINHINNLLPACQIINHYKRSKDLEEFRQYMLTFHKRLERLPNNCIVEKSRRRKAYMLKVAELFDITPDKPFIGKFYFETTPKEGGEQ